MSDFKAFENDTQSITVGPGEGLTFENGTDGINVYGNLDIKPGTSSKQLEELIEVLEEIKNSLILNKKPKP